eukprot:GHRR01029669.1.p4 GENE.GHRR01029669.1~~GHRR01029669.1.p4  ORF type:complete len:101 (+),score=42.59 GHRR01029669.1:2440-2742(+)
MLHADFAEAGWYSSFDSLLLFLQQKIANRQDKKLEIQLDDLRDFLMHMPGAGSLVEEIKGNTQHFLSVIAEAADSQLATLSVTGQVPADIYDALLEAVSS